MRRILFLIFLVMILYFVLSKIWGLLITGKIFEPGALKGAFHDLGKNVWEFMRLFVIVWLTYLVLVWVVRHYF